MAVSNYGTVERLAIGARFLPLTGLLRFQFLAWHSDLPEEA